MIKVRHLLGIALRILTAKSFTHSWRIYKQNVLPIENGLAGEKKIPPFFLETNTGFII